MNYHFESNNKKETEIMILSNFGMLIRMETVEYYVTKQTENKCLNSSIKEDYKVTDT